MGTVGLLYRARNHGNEFILRRDLEVLCLGNVLSGRGDYLLTVCHIRAIIEFSSVCKENILGQCQTGS